MAEPDPIHAVPFPGGIADAAGEHACVRDREGRIITIVLEHGKLLWRSGEALRPLVIARGEVIALKISKPAVCVALPLTGPDAGSERWTSDALPLPDWAEPGKSDPAQFRIAAVLRGGSIVVSWRARARYRGGAAPGKDVLKQAARDDAGSVAIDRAGGSVAPLAAPPEPDPVPQGGRGGKREGPYDLPEGARFPPSYQDTLGQAHIGDRRYELAVQTGATAVQTVLRAWAVPGGELVWETLIDQGAARPPRALRP